jgi:hypothetical protein
LRGYLGAAVAAGATGATSGTSVPGCASSIALLNLWPTQMEQEYVSLYHEASTRSADKIKVANSISEEQGELLTAGQLGAKSVL